MRLEDVVSFKRESFFNGAVQADWFYDNIRIKDVSESYVFHGAKYFGVDCRDIDSSNHSLIDTASFSQTIMSKLYEDKDSSRFMLTIAGYGSGKSHLAVTLAGLFSGHNAELSQSIMKNIQMADENIASNIGKYINSKNLVIVLNGMNNFNLDYEIIKCCKQALEQHGIDSSIVQQMTQAYNIAIKFLENNYDLLLDRFEKSVRGTKYSSYSGIALKNKLIKDIQSDREAFDIVNRVYISLNGNGIRWDEGITGAGVLAKICEKYCQQERVFENILIIFDEFGRYIEYTASNPVVAGDAALQQIFECVQNSNGNMLFTAFIQSDLNAYIQRISQSTNVIRYVGRYEASDKYYLSSNFETVLANLIVKEDKYEEVALPILNTKYDAYNRKLFSSLLRWIGESTKKTVWTREALFKQTIINGCYPMQPLTIWMLTNLSSWMQQRSTLTFVENIIQQKRETMVEGITFLDSYIYPIEIIDSPIFHELYNAEEKGIQNSQYCLLYKEIISRNGDRLTNFDLMVLKAIVIINISKFNTFNKEDLILAIRYCTNMLEENIRATLRNLEDNFGVIEFDAEKNKYFFVAEARGMNEFNRVLRAKKMSIRVSDIGEMINPDILKVLEIDNNVKPAFAQKNKIFFNEWEYSKAFLSIIDFTESYIRQVLKEVSIIPDGSHTRGKIITLYTTPDTCECIATVEKLYNRLQLYNLPIIIFIITDQESKLYNLLIEQCALLSFTDLEQQMYNKFYHKGLESLKLKATRAFIELTSNKMVVTKNGVEVISSTAKNIAMSQLEELFFKVVPFMFDGFERKTTNAIRSFNNICKMMLSKDINNRQVIENETIEVRNKIKAVLGNDSIYSWGILDSAYCYTQPANKIIKEVVDEIITRIPDKGLITGENLFGEYLRAPYTFNVYSISLLMCYILSNNYNRGILIVYDENRQQLTQQEIGTKLFEDKKIGLSKILRYSFAFMEKNLVEQFKDLLVEIKSNQYTHKCEGLLDKLNNLVKTQVIPQELRSDVDYCRELLNTGITKNIDVNNKLAASKRVVKEIVELKDIVRDYEKAAYVITKFPSSANVADSVNFKYSEVVLESYQNLKSIIKELLKNNIEGYIRAISPDRDIRQVKSIQNKVDTIVKRLKSIGLVETQKKALSICDELINEIEMKHKYEMIINNLEVQEKEWRKELSEGYEVLAGNLEKIKNQIHYIKENISDDKVSIKYIESIKQLETEYNNRLEQLKIKVQQQVECILKANSLSQVKNLILDITKKDNAYVPDEMRDKVSEIRKQCEKVEQIVRDLNQDTNISLLQQQMEDYRQSQSIFPSQLIINEIGLIVKDKQLKQEKWVKENLDLDIDFEEISSKECINRINKLQQYPRFITQDTVARIESHIKLLNNRLRQCRVDGVISMFMELDADERRECLRKLEDTSRLI